jgi:hypothetical protein
MSRVLCEGRVSINGYNSFRVVTSDSAKVEAIEKHVGYDALGAARWEEITNGDSSWTFAVMNELANRLAAKGN